MQNVIKKKKKRGLWPKLVIRHGHVSERYLKLMKDREYRLEWAEQLGTGFTLPSQVGILGIPVLVRRRA
jgi:hypothetical protein